MARVFIGIGSNLGDRAANIATAVAKMAELPQTEVVRISSIIETEPVGVACSTNSRQAGQGKFLNGAAELETRLEPLELLAGLQEIERQLGRVRKERWGERTIDLDMLMYDNEVIDEPGLQVPHPLMCEREFVLAPLAEIASNLVHPVASRTIRELLAALRGQ